MKENSNHQIEYAKSDPLTATRSEKYFPPRARKSYLRLVKWAALTLLPVFGFILIVLLSKLISHATLWVVILFLFVVLFLCVVMVFFYLFRYLYFFAKKL